MTAEKKGEKPVVLRDQQFDPLTALYTPGPGPHANIGFNIGRQVNFGELSIKAIVTVQCDQNEQTVRRAAEMAFGIALDFMNEGFETLMPVARTPKEGA